MNTLFVQPDVNETNDLNKFFPLAEIVELHKTKYRHTLKKVALACC
jgi:hypothetical protein